MAGLVKADTGEMSPYWVMTWFTRLSGGAKSLGVVPAGAGFLTRFLLSGKPAATTGYFGLKNNDDWIDEVISNLDLSDKADTNMRALSGG